MEHPYMKIWIVFHCSTEFDSVVAIAETSLSALVELSESVKKTVSENEYLSDLYAMSFWDNITAYESFDVLDWIDEKAIACLDENFWAVLKVDPGAPEADRIRTNCDLLHVDNDGNYFWWTFLPKHGSQTIETPSVSLYDLENKVKEL